MPRRAAFLSTIAASLVSRDPARDPHVGDRFICRKGVIIITDIDPEGFGDLRSIYYTRIADSGEPYHRQDIWYDCFEQAVQKTHQQFGPIRVELAA